MKAKQRTSLHCWSTRGLVSLLVLCREGAGNLVTMRTWWTDKRHVLQFFSIAKTLKPIGWTKFSVAWTHLANYAVCCQYLKPFHMVKHNMQISLRLFSKTLNTFSFSKHILHSNAHVIHTGKHKWQQSNTNREHMSLIEHNHSKLI